MAFFILLIQIVSTLIMTGIIWFVQIVHYPLFLTIPDAQFTKYEYKHTLRTAWVVAPVMLIELGTSLFPLVYPSFYLLNIDYFLALILLLTIWISTFFLQMPLHQKLVNGYHQNTIVKLVRTNWIRTIAWSGRAILLLLYISHIIKI